MGQYVIIFQFSNNAVWQQIICQLKNINCKLWLWWQFHRIKEQVFLLKFTVLHWQGVLQYREGKAENSYLPPVTSVADNVIQTRQHTMPLFCTLTLSHLLMLFLFMAHIQNIIWIKKKKSLVYTVGFYVMSVSRIIWCLRYKDPVLHKSSSTTALLHTWRASKLNIKYTKAKVM